MNYPDDWQQFLAEFQHDVIWDCWNEYGAWGPVGQANADFQNMLLMGGEMG